MRRRDAIAYIPGKTDGGCVCVCMCVCVCVFRHGLGQLLACAIQPDMVFHAPHPLPMFRIEMPKATWTIGGGPAHGLGE